MFVAAGLSQLDVVLTLLMHGGKINETDENGCTPLHVAAATSKIKSLLDHGADPTIRSKKGETPLASLQFKTECVSSQFAARRGAQIMPPQFDPVPTFESMKLLLPRSQRDLLCDGWMSPRMLLPLRTTAELEASDVLEQADWGFHRSAYIPLDVLSKFETDMDRVRMAWANIWKVVALHLQRGMTPTAKRVRSVMEAIKSTIAANNYQAFLQHGGKVEYAIDALIQITRIVVMDGDDGYDSK